MFIKGTLNRVAADTIVGLDNRGDPIANKITPYNCEGFFDDYTEGYKVKFEIPDTDTRIMIFSNSITIKPRQGDEINLVDPKREGSGWFKIRSISVDPASALWVCRSYPIQEPTTDVS